MRTTVLALLCVLSTQALAQQLPESVPVGNGHMTVGFELKTTDKGNGPNGRSSAHTLMDYIIPSPAAIWSEAQRQGVDGWGAMSRAERTAFFFQNYAGGYTANNFVVDTERFPWADKAVSWYGESLKIPHIEIRSAPFDNPREAMRQMKALKAEVSETIAFHMHLRFPDTGLAERAEAMTEYLRRTSFAIWLRRADYSSKPDFVLKQADNQPISSNELKSMLTKLNSTHGGEIMGRRGVRVQRLPGGLIDVEFRGLIKDTRRLTQYVHATAQAFSAEGQVGPWAFDAQNPFREAESGLNIEHHRNSTWSTGELNLLVEEFEKSMERHGVSSSLERAELAKGLKALATAETESGKRNLIASSFNWLFWPIEWDPALPEGIQEEIASRKSTYLRKLVRLAQRVAGGEFGALGSSSYKPVKTASRVRPILYDFINETYTDAGRTAKLFEWYETSLFNPQETVERTERWRAETGRNRVAEFAELRGESARGFGRARPGSERVEPAREHSAREHHMTWRPEEELERARQGMLERVEERLAEATTPAEQRALEEGLERLRQTRFEIFTSADVEAEARGDKIRLSSGLLNEIMEQTAGKAHWAQLPAIRRQALMLIAAHELAHVAGITDERTADREGVRALQKTIYRGQVDEVAIRGAVAAFDKPTGARHLDNLINRLKGFKDYGLPGSRRRVLEATARGEVDALAQYRRVDGTLKWKQVLANRALAEGVGAAHFGLALFLKELAVVGATGDKLRIDEFFDGLLSTDFFREYGLFVAGARVGQVAYNRYLQGFVKPRFVQSIARSSFVLATGLALPRIVAGDFETRTFVVSLGSLGLSSAAVRAGLSRIEWVVELGTARKVSTAGKALTTAGRIARAGARLGGWVYTAAELAVVLLAAEEIEGRVNHWIDDRAARNAVADAGLDLLEAAADPAATAESLTEASVAYHAAWIGYRDHLYAPLIIEEARFAQRLEGAARSAKKSDDMREAMVERLSTNEALAKFALGKHASLREYAEALTARADASVAADVDEYMAAFARDREAGLQAVYQGNRRESGSYLPDDADELIWASVETGGVFQRKTAERAQSELRGHLLKPSKNRLEAYRDEAEFLEALRAVLLERDLGALADALSGAIEVNAQTEVLDRRLAEGETLLEGPGAAEVLEEVGSQSSGH